MNFRNRFQTCGHHLFSRTVVVVSVLAVATASESTRIAADGPLLPVLKGKTMRQEWHDALQKIVPSGSLLACLLAFIDLSGWSSKSLQCPQLANLLHAMTLRHKSTRASGQAPPRNYQVLKVPDLRAKARDLHTPKVPCNVSLR